MFCDPLQKAIVYEDEQFRAFHDIKPDAEIHLQLIPCEHRGTIMDLSSADLPMVERMLEIGKQLLEERGYKEPNARFGFHRPPFNSINHLHMHCLGMPFKFMAERMFPKKGSRWFIPAHRFIEQLKNEQGKDQSN